MPRKKIVLIIVEGPSDQEALGAVLSNLYPSDQIYLHIVHGDITDTDGAFISAENVVELLERDADEKVIYTTTEIQAENVKSIRKRNEQKSSNLNKLLGCSQIWDIPYHVFYMSCNLDHVLHNKLGSTDEEKEQDAYVFAKKYHRATKDFCDFMIHSDFSVVENYDYRSSWNYIKEELHSLERHSNFGLYLQENVETSDKLL